MASKQLLIPDEKILMGIFPDIIDFKSTDYEIISNTFETCTLKFQFHTSPPASYPKQIIIRMELSRGRLDAVMALQRLAYCQLPALIPPVFGIGTINTEDGRLIEYSITPFCSEAVPLATMWDKLDESQQLELVDSVVDAVKQLHMPNLSTIYEVLKETPFILHNRSSQAPQVLIGGPSIGYFKTIKEFLEGLQQKSNDLSSAWRLQEDDHGITIESTYEGVGAVKLSYTDLVNLERCIVFCHNDLEPRNILVTEVNLPEKSGIQYKLAAIIDWELGGFYPVAYEYAYKDNAIGSSNQSFSWYALLRQRTTCLLPPEESHTKLIEAINITEESKRRRMTGNVGVLFREKWIEREQIHKSLDPREGWVRRPYANTPKALTEDEKDKIEMEVLKELGYV